jgi:hypothetical protein
MTVEKREIEIEIDIRVALEFFPKPPHTLELVCAPEHPNTLHRGTGHARRPIDFIARRVGAAGVGNSL